MQRVLLTGFEPFDREAVNPSWEAVRALDGWRPEGAVVHARRIACVFGQALRELDAAIDAVQPTLVIAVGQAGGRAEVTPERVAINVDDGRICDNAGCQPIDEPVVAGAPAAYFSTLPIKAMRETLCDTGFPAEVSQTAGTYVCNHVFYGLMHALRRQRTVRAGFIHIPYSPAQASMHPGAPSVAVETVTEALRLAVRVALKTHTDARLAAGAEH